MYIKTLRLVFFVVLFCSTTSGLSAQGFDNKHLGDLYARLEPFGLCPSFVGDTLIPRLSTSKPVTIQTDKFGSVDHIGFRIFNPSLFSSDNKVTLKFIERILLEIVSDLDDNDLNVNMRLYRLNIFSECFTGTIRQVATKAVGAFNDSTSLSIQRNAVQTTVSCKNGDKAILTIDFPTSYELMTGQTKVEAEQCLYDKLLSWCASSNYQPANITENDLSKSREDKYYIANDGFYLGLKELKSASYYIIEKKNIRPVFDSDAYIESAINLFNTDYAYGVTATVTLDMYSGKRQFDIPLHQFIRFLRSQGCVLYTGIKSYVPGSIECSVFAVNANMGYHHQLIVSIPTTVFSDRNSGNVTMRMYSYVPIHNQVAGLSL